MNPSDDDAETPPGETPTGSDSTRGPGDSSTPPDSTEPDTSRASTEHASDSSASSSATKDLVHSDESRASTEPYPSNRNATNSRGEREDSQKTQVHDPRATTEARDETAKSHGGFRIGMRVGPYVLMRWLGGGGQANVWRAVRTEKFVQLVALKLLPPGVGIDSERADRLRKEAERGGKIDDPAIVKIFDYDHDRVYDTAYLAMQLVDGFTLNDVIKQRKKRLAGAIPPELHSLALLPDKEFTEAIVDLLIKGARAIQLAHEGSIVHRDIKPSNFLLPSGRPDDLLVSDFGLAKDLEDLTFTTDRGIHPGTPIYMAPEKLLGKRGVNEFVSDVYSMGLTLYEAVTLEKAHKIPAGMPKSEQPTFLAHHDAPPPRSIRATLHRDLDAIVRQAISPEPSRRYRSMKEFADDLQRYRNHEEVQARPIGAVERAARNLWRKPLVRQAAAIAGAVMLTAAIATSGWWLWRSAEHNAICSQLLAHIRDGNVETAEGHLNTAREIGVGADRLQELQAELAAKTAELARVSLNQGDPSRARNLIRLWSRLDTRTYDNPTHQLRKYAFRGLLIRTDPPGLAFELRRVGNDGRPIKSGPSILPGVADGKTEYEVLADRYWLTVFDPKTRAFCEGPILVPWRARGEGGVVEIHWVAKPNERIGPEMARIEGGNLPPLPTAATIHPGDALRTLPSFLLGTHEVTNGEFHAYLVEKKLDALRNLLWPENGAPSDADRDLPVVNVSWEDAEGYCSHVGGRLPSEEELAWAGQNLKPSKQAPLRVRADQGSNGLRELLHRAGTDDADRAEHSKKIVFDLMGNVSELSLFRPHDAFEKYGADHPALQGYVVLGGSIFEPSTLRVTPLGLKQNAYQLPGQRNPLVGFRVARSLVPMCPISNP